MAARCPRPRPLGLSRCCRRLLLLFLLLLLGGTGFFQSHAVEVEVKDLSNITCIYAEWMMSFLIKYETNSGEYKNVTLNQLSNVTHEGSICGNSTHAPLLAIQFGGGHSWSINFTKTNETYRGDVILFTYNANDTVFKDAKRKGLITVAVKDAVPPVQLDTVYKCYHLNSVEVANVSQFFWNVTMQAFVQNGTVSKNDSVCDADRPTSAPPTVPAVTNITTLITTASSPLPTTTSKPAEKPLTGNYSLKEDNKICLLATMGLQLNVSREKPVLININPNTTHVTGSCGNTSATLRLNDSNSRFIDFTFAVKNKSGNAARFYLKEVNITLISSTNGSEPLSTANNNLSTWETFLGSSYMCQKEQTVVVNEGLQIHTFDLRIQPFNVKDNKYAKAQECSLDDDTVLIPIIVGAALAGLIIIIVIAYLIGRRKTYAGYQTL